MENPTLPSEPKAAEPAVVKFDRRQEQSSVAICCLHSARMLEIADDGVDRGVGEIARIRAANAGQAKLLREAAKIADEMLFALKANTANLRELERVYRDTDPKFADILAVNIAGNDRTIAKAEGR